MATKCVFSVLPSACQHCVKVYKFSVHLHSGTLKVDYCRIVLPEEPSNHVTASWWFLVKFYPPDTPCQDRSRKKLNCFIKFLPTWERTVPALWEL